MYRASTSASQRYWRRYVTLSPVYVGQSIARLAGEEAVGCWSVPHSDFTFRVPLVKLSAHHSSRTESKSDILIVVLCTRFLLLDITARCVASCRSLKHTTRTTKSQVGGSGSKYPQTKGLRFVLRALVVAVVEHIAVCCSSSWSTASTRGSPH